MTEMKTAIVKPTKQDVEWAMQILLTKKQIKYVKWKTPLGPSKVATIRSLLNIGIEKDIKTREAWLANMDMRHSS